MRYAEVSALVCEDLHGRFLLVLRNGSLAVLFDSLVQRCRQTIVMKVMSLAMKSDTFVVALQLVFARALVRYRVVKVHITFRAFNLLPVFCSTKLEEKIKKQNEIYRTGKWGS